MAGMSLRRRTKAARWLVALVLLLATAVAADAADPLTAGDLAWLRDSLNLAADSPALLTLSEAQKTRLHDLIAARSGPDRKRQNVVQFLTGVAGGSLEQTLDAARPAPLPSEPGENGSR